ncbi:MAG TPA: response regulator transcription factor [Rugosimonospora sp.]
MTSVVLVDDQALVRIGIATLLDLEDDIEVVGQADNGEEALELIARLRPDVVLMDIRMPGLDGLAALTRIVADPGLRGVHVVMLTTFTIDEYIFEAVQAGAAGYLVKNSEPEDLIRGVRAAADGDALLSPAVTRRLMSEYATRARLAPPTLRQLDQLTDREREVLTLVATGLSNTELAERLFISPLTAKTHVSRIMTKLYARDRAQLVVAAYESGLVSPGWSDSPRR